MRKTPDIFSRVRGFFSQFGSGKEGVQETGKRPANSPAPDSKVPELADPADPSAQVTPADLKDADDIDEGAEGGDVGDRPNAYPAGNDETAKNLQRAGTNDKRVLQYAKELYNDAARKRRELEYEWALNISFMEGRQWIGYDPASQQLKSLINDNEHQRYTTFNLIAPIVGKLVALSIMTQPDANAAAASVRDIDQKAASEANSIIGYCDEKFHRPVQTGDRVWWAMVCGCSFLECRWDDSAEALIPDFDEQGNLTDVLSLPDGDIDEHLRSPLDVYIDPSCRSFDDAAYVILRERVPLSCLQEWYGQRGYTVNPTQISGNGSEPSYLQGMTGGAFATPSAYGQNTTNQSAIPTAVVERIYVKATPRRPKGQYIVVASDKLMYYGDLPYDKKDTLPVVPLYYNHAVDSPYGTSLVGQLRPLQVSYNRVLSSTQEQMEQQFDYLLNQNGNDVDLTDLTGGTRRILKRVGFRAGTQPPTVVRSPGISTDRFELLNIIYERMQDIAGVHDVSHGETPPGVTAGISIELLQQSDQTQLKTFIDQIESTCGKIHEWEIALFAQCCPTPRLMGLSQSDNPDEQRGGVMAFEALSSGGQTRVRIRPGSATPRSAAGQKQEIFEMYNMGILGPIGTPDTTAAKTAIGLLKIPQSDQILDALREVDANNEKMAQMQAAMQQQQQQHDMAMAQAQAQNQASLQGQQHGQEQLQAQQAAASQQSMEAQKAQADKEAQAELERQRAELSVETHRQQAMINLGAEAAKAHILPQENGDKKPAAKKK